MKRLAIVLLIVLLPSLVLAQYEPAEVHVVVQLPSSIEGLTAAEFSISNLPHDECLIEEVWDSNLTLGTIGYGFAIAFTEAQPGPLVHLGTLFFTAFEPVATDHEIWVLASLGSGELVIVDESYVTHDSGGWFHAFNCDQSCDCMYDHDGQQPNVPYPEFGLWAVPDEEICDQDLPVFPTATDGSNWSAIKSLY